MSAVYSAETHDPAWVSDGDAPAVLMWVDRETGKPVAPIGVGRECDIPGLHTPGASARVLAVTVEKQHDRMWPKA